MNKRPTFFLSSTVYDFRDLRSALKFSLEERGCTVLASEFNDFRVALDKHSYDACLSNIEQSDYFVLLIGGRVGGWFDKARRISITQQEYRTAYELHKAGKLKLLTFVRTEIWQAREDRKALERHLAGMELEDRERDAIWGYPSKHLNDAAFITDFISEVGRNVETTDAVNAGGLRPTGNWIHTFSNFRDIQDVLSPLAFSGRTADEAAYSSALQHELLILLARFLVKIKGEPFDVCTFLQRHLASAPIGLADREAETINVDAEAWQAFASLMIHALGQNPNLFVIQDALTSPLFMDYNPQTGAYEQSPAYLGLAKLIDEVRRYNAAATPETLSLIYEYSPKRIGRPPDIDLPVLKLAGLYNLAQRWVNIVILSRALVLHLAGRPYVEGKLQPLSPIQGMTERIERERVTISEARSAIGL